MTNSNSIRIALLKYNCIINREIFKDVPITDVIFIADLNKAIIETNAPKVYIIGERAAVSNISLSTAIIELTVLLINDSNTSKTEVPTGRDGNISPINAIFWFFKVLPLKFFGLVLTVFVTDSLAVLRVACVYRVL